MKLKTLKDIFLWKEGKDFNPELCASNKKLLRMVAREHIKHLQRYLDMHSFGTVNINYTEIEEARAKGQIAWIIHFFNLEEK